MPHVFISYLQYAGSYAGAGFSAMGSVRIAPVVSVPPILLLLPVKTQKAAFTARPL